MRFSHNAQGTSESVDSREKSIDRSEALRLIQQRHVAALRNFKLRKVRIPGFHPRESGGAQDVGPFAANRQHGYAAQPLPEGP